MLFIYVLVLFSRKQQDNNNNNNNKELLRLSFIVNAMKHLNLFLNIKA